MRSTRRRSWALMAAAAVGLGLLAPVAVSASGRAGGEPAGASAQRTPDPEPSGSECRTAVEGSRVTAYCHNPHATTDLVRLHTECARWWDVDADGEAVAVQPGRTVKLEDRCWKEVGSAWVSHSVTP
ncbi:hypothetical protein ACFYY2_21300 [Streptomyces sp. NPDC001822]|uniref:hypothetical protein n=1 Tax=Streptomyces sp. NPDC001822 TaxID=3364614 RepID=UPI00369546C4